MRKLLVGVIAVCGVLIIGVHFLRGAPDIPQTELSFEIELRTVKRGAETVLQGAIGKTKFQAPSLVVNVGRPNESVFTPVDEQVQMKQGKRVITAAVMRFTLRDGEITRTAFDSIQGLE